MIPIVLTFAFFLSGCASSGNSDDPKAKSRDGGKDQFEVEIQSGGSGTTLDTDELSDFSYLDVEDRTPPVAPLK